MHYFKNYILFFFSVLKYCSLRKITNFIGLYSSYLFHRNLLKFNIKLRPAFISVEPADFCQLKCPECPVGRNGRSSGTKIDSEFFRNYIDELKRELFHVIFYFQGEPLMNRNFTNLVLYAHSKNMLTSTSTNAQLINSETAKKIVESGLDRLIISIDGATQETYEAYRVGGRLDKAIEAVENLIKWKNVLKSRSPFIEIQFLVLKTNEHQLKEMKQLARKLKAGKLTFKSAQLYDFENGNPFLPDNKRYSRYEQKPDGRYYIKNPLRNRCRRMWYGAVVTTRGDVLPCCFDKDSSFVFGNLKDKSFLECLNGIPAAEFKEAIRKNRRQFEMCRNCTEK